MNNKEIAKAWFTAIDTGNFASNKNMMDANHKFHNPMMPAPAGPDEHIGMMNMMSAAFTGRHQLDLILEDGNHVVIRGRYIAKHTGEFNGVGATGKEIVLSFIDIFEIVDGKVRNEILEMNPMSIMAQIGAVPANA